MCMLNIDSPAPAFSVPNENDELVTLDSAKTRFTLIYFYPKDDTPGCTTEACGLRDVFKKILSLDCTIYGVSKDSPAKHAKFKEKYNLPFSLLADESTEMIQAYGAWQEKSMYGKKYMGIARMSYLLDGNKVVKVYPKVSPKTHAEQIVEDLTELSRS